MNGIRIPALPVLVNPRIPVQSAVAERPEPVEVSGDVVASLTPQLSMVNVGAGLLAAGGARLPQMLQAKAGEGVRVAQAGPWLWVKHVGDRRRHLPRGYIQRTGNCSCRSPRSFHEGQRNQELDRSYGVLEARQCKQPTLPGRDRIGKHDCSIYWPFHGQS